MKTIKKTVLSILLYVLEEQMEFSTERGTLNNTVLRFTTKHIDKLALWLMFDLGEITLDQYLQ